MNRNIQSLSALSSNNNSSNSNRNYLFQYEDEINNNCEEDSFKKLYYTFLENKSNATQCDTTTTC